jgi:hypothetical protein
MCGNNQSCPQYSTPVHQNLWQYIKGGGKSKTVTDKVFKDFLQDSKDRCTLKFLEVF